MPARSPIKIIWDNEARQYWFDALRFYNKRNGNPIYSSKLQKELQHCTQLLQTHHFLGYISQDDKIRVLHVYDFAIFYKINPDHIRILRIRSSHQLPCDFNEISI